MLFDYVSIVTVLYDVFKSWSHEQSILSIHPVLCSVVQLHYKS